MVIIDKFGNVLFGMKGVDINGNPVERSKEDYPYSYDFFVIWKKDYIKEKSNVLYSDRLRQWDRQKYDDCCMEVWGDKRHSFYSRNPEEIEAFLYKYIGKNIKLTVVMEGCNISSGYPIWSFHYENLEH